MSGMGGRIGDRDVVITDHAAARMVEMRMTAHQVSLTLTNPDAVFTSKKYPGDTCYRRGDFTLATRVDEDGRLVVKTALFSRMSVWRTAAKRGLLGDGRQLRTDTGIPE